METADVVVLMESKVAECAGILNGALAEVMGEEVSISEAAKLARVLGRRLGALLVERMGDDRTGYCGPYRGCDCGGSQRFVDYRSITVETMSGPVEVSRAYYWCSCGAVWYGGEKFLSCRKSGWSDDLVEAVTLVGTLLPSFAMASDVLDRLSGVKVDRKQVERMTEEIGDEVRLAEREESEEIWDRLAPSTDPPERMVIQADGSSVHTRGEWKEAKLAVIYNPEDLVERNQDCTSSEESEKRPRRELTRKRYVGLVGPVEEFRDALALGAAKESVFEAKKIAFMGDGAPWIWNTADEQVPDAVQILDWYHAAEHIHDCGKKVHGQGTSACEEWVKAIKDDLWEGRVGKVLRDLKKLEKELPKASEEIEELSTYLRNNRRRVDYPAYRAAGWDIGTGTIESSNKRVVGSRLKQPGMRWTVEGANKVLALRTAYFSDRWDELWNLPEAA